jgi:ubiquinone/menaquinone biosynthesis C-methylase UbiE
MPIDNTAFVGSIPENYDRYLGPVMFDPYARDLVERLKVPAGAAVLELACGTGIVTRRLRNRLPSTVQLIATDLNEAMFKYGAGKFGPEEAVEWKQADAIDLPFAAERFDAVVCQFGLMFFPDKEKAAAEIYRVLKPGGIFLFNVWDAIELNDLANTTQTIITKYFPDNPPTFYQVPFSFYDREKITSLLTGTGFKQLELSELALPAISDSASNVARGLLRGNPVITAIDERNEAKAEDVEAALASSIAAQFGVAPTRARMQAIVCSARK